jgi:hypothetical protein
MLVVEQSRTIEAQRGLLRDMLKDSTQLAVLKGKLARESAQQSAGKLPGKSQKDQPEQSANPAPAAPKAPTRNEPHGRARAPNTMREVPSKPAEDLRDVRRSTRMI